jgi:hypothetical protein
LHAYSNFPCAGIGRSIKIQRITIYIEYMYIRAPENIVVYIQPEKLQNI